MPNIELQLMHDNLGDTYLMANTACGIPAVKDPESEQWVYTPGAELQNFGEHANGRLIRKLKDAEKPLGEWNVVDLYCFGTTLASGGRPESGLFRASRLTLNKPEPPNLPRSETSPENPVNSH